MIVVVGASLRQREDALGELRTVLLLGGPVALALACLLGYAVAALALRGVESMRRRALHVSLVDPGQRLPVPAGNDELARAAARGRPRPDELARLARTLNEMLSRNELAFERERAFVADASHELRSPLAILRAELDVALMGESSEEELRRTVISAAEETDRLSALADDLLLLARADEGNLPMHRRPLHLHEMLERLAERFAQQAQDAGAVIETRAEPDVRIDADPRRMEQALGNLVENALRHGAHTIVVAAELYGRRLELHVSDDGAGFPPGFREVAFERFTRADRPRTEPGAGLGLAIVRSIARAHGGEAYISGEEAGGAHVWLSIPDAAGGVSGSVHDRSDGGSQPASLSTR